MLIHLDFETRSEAMLPTVGGYVYSKHPSTTILCAAYAIDDKPVKIIKMHPYEINKQNKLFTLAAEKTNVFIAHNAFFEYCIYHHVLVERYGYPEIPLNRWRCSSAQALSYGLPKKLETAAIALGCEYTKDKMGTFLINKLSVPQKPTVKNPSIWCDDVDKLNALYRYCIKDVKVAREIATTLQPLSSYEQQIWECTQRMNLAGLYTDIDLIDKAIPLSIKVQKQLVAEFSRLTNGIVNSPSCKVAFKNWMTTHGYEQKDMRRETILAVLADENQRARIAPKGIAALEINILFSKSSVKKYETFKNTRADDGRVRGFFIYHAASTGRWGSSNVQLQNLPRPDGTIDATAASEDVVLHRNLDLIAKYPKTMNMLSQCVRGVIKAPSGKNLYVADYSAIEARGVAWLAGQQNILQAFSNNIDVYCETAAQIFNRPIDKKENPFERQIGKVATLALGYQGGISAFAKLAKSNSLDLTELKKAIEPTITPAEKQNAERAYSYYSKNKSAELNKAFSIAVDVVKQRWRLANSQIVNFWDVQEQTAIAAVVNEGTLYNIGHIKYQKIGRWLYCLLPSRRLLAYDQPEVSFIETPWGSDKASLSHMTFDSQVNKYIRVKTYGGRLVENITQAICRDILADAMLRLENTQYKTILTVHDELVTEAANGSVQELCELMCTKPKWCLDFPLSAEGWEGKRYKK